MKFHYQIPTLVTISKIISYFNTSVTTYYYSFNCSSCNKNSKVQSVLSGFCKCPFRHDACLRLRKKPFILKISLKDVYWIPVLKMYEVHSSEKAGVHLVHTQAEQIFVWQIKTQPHWAALSRSTILKAAALNMVSVQYWIYPKMFMLIPVLSTKANPGISTANTKHCHGSHWHQSTSVYSCLAKFGCSWAPLCCWSKDLSFSAKVHLLPAQSSFWNRIFN